MYRRSCKSVLSLYYIILFRWIGTDWKKLNDLVDLWTEWLGFVTKLIITI